MRACAAPAQALTCSFVLASVALQTSPPSTSPDSLHSFSAGEPVLEARAVAYVQRWVGGHGLQMSCGSGRELCWTFTCC